MRKIKQKVTISGIAILALLSLSISSCSVANANVSISSQAFSPGSSVLSVNPDGDLYRPMAMSISGMNSFAFCVTQIKLDAAGGDSTGLLEARLGLIDVGDGSIEVNWGDVAIPDGTEVATMHIEVHNDPETCSGATYSASMNGQTITQDVEMSFTFDPPITAAEGGAVTLDLSPIADAFMGAINANSFNDQNITTYIETLPAGSGN